VEAARKLSAKVSFTNRLPEVKWCLYNEIQALVEYIIHEIIRSCLSMYNQLLSIHVPGLVEDCCFS